MKKAVLVAGIAAVPLVVGIPTGLGKEHTDAPRAILSEEERHAWKGRRKNIVRSYEPEYHDDFP